MNLINRDISEDDYRFMKTDFETKCFDLQKEKEKLNNELNDYNDRDLFGNPIISTYTKYKGIEKLDRRVVASLIDSIIIDETNSIKILFKFQDEIKKHQFKNL